MAEVNGAWTFAGVMP